MKDILATLLVITSMALLLVNHLLKTELQKQMVANKALTEAAIQLNERQPDVAILKENETGDLYLRVKNGATTHYFHFPRVCPAVRNV